MYPLGALPPPPPGAHLTMTLIIVGNEEAKMSSLLKLKVNLPVSGFAFASLAGNRQPAADRRGALCLGRTASQMPIRPELAGRLLSQVPSVLH